MKLNLKTSKLNTSPFSYRLLGIICVLTLEMALLMIYWRIKQIVPAIESILAHKKNEMSLIVNIAILRQVLRGVCILFGVSQVVVSFHILSGSYDIFQQERKNLQKVNIILYFISLFLQYFSMTDLYTNIFMISCMILQGYLTILVLEKQPYKVTFFAILAAYCTFLIGIFLYSYIFCHSNELTSSKKGVSTDPVANLNITRQIWNMSTENDFFHAAFYEQKEGMNYGLVPIPGMKYADSVTGGKNSHKETCTSMTPQGIAVSDNFIFISAYCYTHEHNSVIFVMDRETGKYIKELVLPEKTHVGGLAYDPEYGTLWLTSKMEQSSENGTEKVSALACLTDEDIMTYSFIDSEEPIEYRNICPTQFKSNSCLTYKDGYLYIGYWLKSKFAMSIAGKFEIRKTGVSVKDRASEYLHIPGQVQGIAFHEDQIYFTVSYGLPKSTILMYNLPEENEAQVYSASSPEKSIDMPQMLEEICLYNGQIYTLFESSAFAYRNTAPVCMDHIVKMRITGF